MIPVPILVILVSSLLTMISAQSRFDDTFLCGFDIFGCDENVATIRKKYHKGSTICSPDNKFYFGIVWNGDLCLCSNSNQKLWCAGIEANKAKDPYMIMQGDGNLVVYGNKKRNKRETLWSSRTPRNHGAHLFVKSQGLAEIVSPYSERLWSTPSLDTENPTIKDSSQSPSTILANTQSPAPTLSVSISPSIHVTDPFTSFTSPTNQPSNPTTTSISTTSTNPTNKILNSAHLSTLSLSPSAIPAGPTSPPFHNRLVLYVFGDTPYAEQDFPTLRSKIALLPNDAEALIHVGDIKRGNGKSCPISSYTRVYDELANSHAPVFIVPGDNEVNDCPNFDKGWENWSDTFLAPNRVTEQKWNVTHLGNIERVHGTANFAFVYKGTLIMGVDVPGGKPHNRKEWNKRHRRTVDWMMVQIKNYTIQHHKESGQHAILIFGHGRPGNFNAIFFQKLYSQLSQNLLVDTKRLLYIHGDGHTPQTHVKYGIKCVQVDLGRRKWLRLHISASQTDPIEYTHGVFQDPTPLAT